VQKLAQAMFVALFVVWVSFGTYWQQSSIQPNYNQAVERSHDRTENSGPKIIADERIANYTWWVAAFTCALSVVSAFQIFFLIRADKTARISAESAKQSAEAGITAANAAVKAEQAHVYPIIGYENIVQVVQSRRTTQKTREIRVSYRLKNFGKTPAMIIQAGHELVCAPDPPKGNAGIRSFFEVTKVLGPDGDVSDPPTDCTAYLSPDDAQLVLESKATVWFHGFVRYEDVLGFERHLEYSWWYRGDHSRFGWNYFVGGESKKRA
jgi:hypothetical protein